MRALATAILLLASSVVLSSAVSKVQLVTVEPGVKLEVIDWGGQGRAVILLAGFGNDAHVFDKFAPKLTDWYHVYGVTRRGFGASSAPPTGYSADRLGDDVVAVMNALKIDRPVLIGHSLAGEELSYVGFRYPQKVAGLVYLDAGYVYAFYDTSGRALNDSAASALQMSAIDIDEVQRKLTELLQMTFMGNRQKAGALIDELMATELPRVTTDLPTLKRVMQSGTTARFPPVAQAFFSGLEEFTAVRVPILAIFADPHARGTLSTTAGRAPAQMAAEEALDKEFVEAQIAATQRAAPGAHIVRLPHANHYVFLSNEAEVLQNIHGFIQALPPR
jgi:pimeloyl-ACP methyl ester carboxylesterase